MVSASPSPRLSTHKWCSPDHRAYERLSDVKWGVMGIQYQEVPCTKAADNPAPPIANPTPRERADLFSSALPRPSV